MSALSHDDILHIAALARLHLTPEEAEKYGPQLSAILGYIDILQEVDTSNVKPTAQVTGQRNSLRNDEIIESDITGDALLECSPLPIIDHQIQTDSAHG